jgi:hypothetical protein
MAFLFRVETGAGLSTATSYVDVPDADAVAEESAKLRDAWLVLPEDEKQRTLVYATRTLDASMVWLGKRSSKTQGLGWPRRDLRDEEGDELPSDFVPKPVRDATVFLAMSILNTDPLTIDESRRISSVKAESLSVSFRDGSTGEPRVIPQMIRGLLVRYGTARENLTTAKVIRV